ncbi:MAG: STAS-like domain-containing protein [Verrucomicrobiota bacterium]
MTHEIHLREGFGLRLSDGSQAYSFRITNIDPYLAICDQVILDFTGIRSANSSFINALISGLFEQHGVATLNKLVFRGCLPTIQVLVQSAVDLGMLKHSERATSGQ